MPASEAQIRANQANSRLSTGPRTPAGLQASASNSLKHGLTAKKLIPELEAVEVERRFVAFCEELKPSGEVGIALARQAAAMSVRAERCFEHENAMLTERVRKAEADFIPPEGVGEDVVARLRAEAGKRALFDDSKEATLARKYEAAAQRGFYRALKELRLLEKQAQAIDFEKIQAEVASILPSNLREMNDEEFDKYYADFMAKPPIPPPPGVKPVDLANLGGRVDVPFAIGKRP